MTLKHLVMIDSGGSVIPGNDSGLRMETTESDEILRFRYINRFAVHSSGEKDDCTDTVAEWYRIDCVLHLREFPGTISRHAYHPLRHFRF